MNNVVSFFSQSSDPRRQYILILVLFFLSGFAALSYQIVWTRLLLYTFGNTTHSVVAVLAAVMMGLGVGGYVFGRYAHRFSNSLRVLAFVECGVGLWSLFTLTLISHSDRIYSSIVSADTATDASLIFIKFVITGIILFPATFLMGGTLPIILRSCLSQKKEHPEVVAMLYGVNTLGSVCGALVTAFALIEIFGLHYTLAVAVVISMCVACVFLHLSTRKILCLEAGQDEARAVHFKISKKREVITLVAYGVSGGASMALEVLWTRLLTPFVGTYIYSFSLVLAIFLLGLAFGGFAYTRFCKNVRQTFILLGFTEIVIGLSAALSVGIGLFTTVGGVIAIGAIVLPGTFAMGTILPILSTLSSRKESSSFIGRALLSNTVGSMLGPIVAGFFLIRWFGTLQSILVVAGCSFFLAAVFIALDQTITARRNSIMAVCVIGLAFIIFSGEIRSFEKNILLSRFGIEKNVESHYYEDEVASVFASSDSDSEKRRLIIDGIDTTRLVGETKVIGHLPLLVHPNPKRVLIVGMGMGTTFRSALSHQDSYVDVAELVPSVPRAFPLFHLDAEEVLHNSRGGIIINDGRQYIARTSQLYDVVTIDPPPPINSAGTTVLYSQEFYRAIKKKLLPEGIVQQWFYFDGNTQEEELKMMLYTLSTEFKHTAVLLSAGGVGLHVLASEEPFAISQKEVMSRIVTNADVQKDINEWEGVKSFFESIDDYYLGDEKFLERYTGDTPVITDAHPRTEYFLIRRMSAPSRFIDAPALARTLLGMKSQKKETP